MAGPKSDNGRGADIVISHMQDLVRVVHFFRQQRRSGVSAPFDFPDKELLSGMRGEYFLPAP